MNDSISNLLNIVNINSYATSDGFLGYYESSIFGEHRKEAIDFFLHHFGNIINKAFIVCSLTQSVVHETTFSVDVKHKIDKLAHKGWIEIDKSNEKIMESFALFKLNNTDIDFVRLLCELVIEGYTYGHVFFFWEHERLIIYPHEDFGFGVLASPKSHGEKIGCNFLMNASLIEYFNVDISEACQ